MKNLFSMLPLLLFCSLAFGQTSVKLNPVQFTAFSSLQTGKSAGFNRAILNHKAVGDTTNRLADTNKFAYDYNKPFWVELGSNLDLTDGTQANNLFYGIFLYKREIRRLRKGSGDDSRIGLFAGVFQSRTMSDVSESTQTSRYYYNQSSLALKQGINVGVFADTGSVKKIQMVKNLGMFFSPQLRLTNGSSNEDGLHVFTSLWMELQWQRISVENDYSAMTRRDTLFVNPASLGKYSPLSTKTEFDIRSHYFGAGLPIFFKQGAVNVFFNPVIGASNQPTSAKLDQAILMKNNDLQREWKPFYVFQFRLNEEQYGFAVSGEVRGLIVKQSKPFVTLVLSKKFDLSKLIKFSNN